jgi:hypothetical protein
LAGFGCVLAAAPLAADAVAAVADAGAATPVVAAYPGAASTGIDRRAAAAATMAEANVRNRNLPGGCT